MYSDDSWLAYWAYVIPGLHCTIIVGNLGVWNYAYLGHKIQNVLSQGSTVPFNAQESYIFIKSRQKQDWNSAFLVLQVQN